MRRTEPRSPDANDSTAAHRANAAQQTITSPTSSDVSTPNRAPNRSEKVKNLRKLSIQEYYAFINKDPIHAQADELIFSELTIREASELTARFLRNSQQNNNSREIANEITTTFIKKLIDKVIEITRSNDGIDKIFIAMKERKNQTTAASLIHALCGESNAIENMYTDGSLSKLIDFIIQFAKNTLSVYRSTQTKTLVEYERDQKNRAQDGHMEFEQLTEKIKQIRDSLAQTTENSNLDGSQQNKEKNSELRLLMAARALQVHYLEHSQRQSQEQSSHREHEHPDLHQSLTDIEQTSRVIETAASHLCFGFMDELISFVENCLSTNANRSQDTQHLIGAVLGCVRLIDDKQLSKGLEQIYRIWDSMAKSDDPWKTYQTLCEDKTLKRGVYRLFFVFSRVCQTLYAQSKDKNTKVFQTLAHDLKVFLEAFCSKPAANTPLTSWSFAEQLTLVITIIGADWPIERIEAILQIPVNEAGKWAKSVEMILNSSPNTDTRLIQLVIMMVNTLLKTILQQLPEEISTNQGIRKINDKLTKDFCSLNNLMAPTSSGDTLSNNRENNTFEFTWLTVFEITRYLHSIIPNILTGVIEEIQNAVPDAKYTLNKIGKLTKENVFSTDNLSFDTVTNAYQSTLSVSNKLANIADLVIIAFVTLGNIIRTTLSALASPANTQNNSDAARVISRLIESNITKNLSTSEKNKFHTSITAIAKTASYELIHQPNTVRIFFLSIHTYFCFTVFALCNIASLARLQFHSRMFDPLIQGLRNICEIIYVLAYNPISIALSLIRFVLCIMNQLRKISFDPKIDKKWRALIGVSLFSADWISLRILPYTCSLLCIGISQLSIYLQPLLNSLIGHHLLQGTNGTAIIASVGVILVGALLLPQINTKQLTTSVQKTPADPSRANELNNNKNPGLIGNINRWWQNMTATPRLNENPAGRSW